jgi:[phosphatase 2A protein]-leucine-carboxy methyltransferase
MIPAEHGDSRTSKLEMLDEVEELNLVLQHYAITWGVKVPDVFDSSKSKSKAKWVEWGMGPSAETVNNDGEDESV